MQKIVLASRPDGAPTLENFRLEEGPIPEPGAGESRATGGTRLALPEHDEFDRQVRPSGGPAVTRRNETRRETRTRTTHRVGRRVQEASRAGWPA